MRNDATSFAINLNLRNAFRENLADALARARNGAEDPRPRQTLIGHLSENSYTLFGSFFSGR